MLVLFIQPTNALKDQQDPDIFTDFVATNLQRDFLATQAAQACQILSSYKAEPSSFSS